MFSRVWFLFCFKTIQYIYVMFTSMALLHAAWSLAAHNKHKTLSLKFY